MQRVNTLAARVVGISVSVRSRCGVSRVVPGEAFASGFGFDIVCAVIDRQMQRVSTMADGVVCISLRVRSR